MPGYLEAISFEQLSSSGCAHPSQKDEGSQAKQRGADRSNEIRIVSHSSGDKAANQIMLKKQEPLEVCVKADGPVAG